MQREKLATKEERIAFYAEYDGLFERCSYLTGASPHPESQLLVDAARARFAYSPKTYSRDILGSLFRGWRKWRKEGAAGQ